jgi:hypothetical protein
VYPAASPKPAYSASDQLTCVYPYGAYTSLDGVFPNAAGQQLIAWAAASAINNTYGLSLPTAPVSPVATTAARLCP